MLSHTEQPFSLHKPSTGHSRRAKASSECIEIQRSLLDDIRKEEVSAAVRAQLARAWGDLQKLRLQMAMKPAPKPIDVSKLQKKQRTTGIAPELSTLGPTNEPAK